MMRKINKLLTLLKKKRDGYQSNALGLCSISIWMYGNKEISKDELHKLQDILKKNKPKDIYDTSMGYWFPPDGIARGEFLDNLIVKYKKETK
jgi:hypothetical protein